MKRNITLESKIESLRVVEKIIDEISDKHRITDELYGNLLIATIESVQNAIIHGNKFDPGKAVELRIKIADGKLVVITRDQGNGFDINDVPDPTEPQNIEKNTGRGVFLMKHLTDKLTYHEDGRVAEFELEMKSPVG